MPTVKIPFWNSLSLVLPDAFAKTPAILSVVTDLGCIRKCIFNSTGFSNNIFLKENFFDNAFIFCVIFFTISWSSHNGSLENVSNSV